MMARWYVKRLANGLGDHAAAWDALNLRLFNAHPMLDSRLVDGLLKHFGNGTEHLCVLELNGMSEAMCLLIPKGLGRWATFLPAQAQIGPGLMSDPAAIPDLIRSLPGIATAIDFLCNDPAFGDLAHADGDPTNTFDHALTMNISLAGDFGSYWSERSKNLKQNIDRYQRRLVAENITKKLVSITDTKDINAAVVRYGNLESEGWKGKAGTAVGVANAQGCFYTELMRSFSATSHAMIFELWFDEKLVASRLAIASADMVIILKTTYDESFDKYAPGRQLLHDMTQRLFTTHPGKVIEFYTDANVDQLAWATGQRWIKHVSFYRSALAANLFKLLRASHHALTAGRRASGEADSTYSVEVFRHPDEFTPDVLQLFAMGEIESVEFGADWYRNFVNTVHANHDGIRFFVLRKQGRPVAALPVLAQQSALGHKVKSLSNYYTSIYAPLIDRMLKVHDLVPLIRAVRDAHAPLGSLKFAPMNPASASYRTLFGALQAVGLVPFSYFCFGNWYLKVTDDWHTYLKNRKGTIRSTLKRMTKKFSAEGGTLELVQAGPSLDRGLAAYEHVYSKSWKKPEPYSEFIPGLIRLCAERGWLRLGVAWLQGKPIAAQLWIVAHGRANIYKVAYDENYKAYASGTLLTAMLMEQVLVKDHVAEVDYLIGDDPYKKSWMSHRRERWGIMAYNPKTIGGIWGLGKEVLGRTLKPLISRIRSLRTQAQGAENQS